MDTEQVMSTNAWEAAVIYQPFGCQDPDMLFDDYTNNYDDKRFKCPFC